MTSGAPLWETSSGRPQDRAAADRDEEAMDLNFLGPPLESGPLPAVFYFSLSAHDSLHLDPYNQPALALMQHPMRVFSFTIPGHQLPPTEALNFWAAELEKGNDLITTFAEEVSATIEELIRREVASFDKIAVMGLSRGVFIGAHVAARCKLISHLLGFAPLTRLDKVKEFEQCTSSLVEQLNLQNLSERLYDRTIRCYIGNRDLRVGTGACFHFISALADAAHHQKIRSAPIELVITPSIGHLGHGTSPETFREGARWLANQLGLS